MGFNRTAFHQTMPARSEMTARMVGIGMNFAAQPTPDAESTLVHASVFGIVDGDLGALAVLTT